MNEFLDLISSPLMNLDHTYRYSGTKLVEEESLSQHIVDTIMLGLRMIDRINHIAGNSIINPSKYVMKAVYHDLEESITGDIPRPLKYYNESTLASLKDVADDVAKKFFNTQFYEGEEHYVIWEHSKEGATGYILKLVDNLVVVNKVIKEVTLLHNYYMLRVAHEVLQYTQSLYENKEYMKYFEDPNVYTYISSVLEDAVLAMQSILEENKEVTTSLSLHSQSMI